MNFKQITAVSAMVGVAAAGVAQPFPLKNGFPAPSDQALAEIQQHAGGGLPNIEFPTKISDAAAVTFALIGLEEILEVAFFTELLHNVTHDVPGYKLFPREKAVAVKTLRRIRSQEELHYLGANGALEGAGRAPVSPCTYNFPAETYQEALAVANFFTDVNIAIAPEAQQLFADDGGQERKILIKVVGAIEVEEAQQVGFFRASQGKPAAATPFLTQGANPFFATSINKFIVPGSCKSPFPDVPIFPDLTVVGTPQAKDKTLNFEVAGGGISADANSIVYMTGLSLPKTVPIKNVKKMGKVTTFSANFPFTTYSGGFASGLSFAALVKGHNDMYTDAEEVAVDTVNLAFLEIQ